MLALNGKRVYLGFSRVVADVRERLLCPSASLKLFCAALPLSLIFQEREVATLLSRSATNSPGALHMKQELITQQE